MLLITVTITQQTK